MSDSETEALREIEARYSVDDQIRDYLRTGIGLNWESFSRQGGRTAGELFWGAVKLPDNTEDAIWRGARHWAAALGDMRNALPDAVWRVAVEDHELQWDEQTKRYDLSR